MRSSGTLTISLTEEASPMLAGVSYIFSIELTNGFSDQHSPVEMVVASRSEYISTHTNMVNDPTEPSNIYKGQVNDLYPMYIRNVSWEVKQIGQTSPYRKCFLSFDGTLHKHIIHISTHARWHVCVRDIAT